MSSTMSATAKTILKGPTDWIQWLEMVKSTATTGQVWVYVDPSKTDAQLPPLVEPTWPEPGNLARTQEEITTGVLTTAHKEELSEQRSLYKLRLNRYDQRRTSLAHLHRFIQETVHPDHIHYTFECDTVHEMLVNLQRRLKLTDDIRRLQLTDQYRQLQKSPKNKELDTWLLNWERTYREGIKLSQPIIQKDTAVQDFLRAVSEIASDFASFWTNTIQNNPPTTTTNAQGEIITVDTRPDLYTVIDRFRIQRQILRADSAKLSSNRSAFPTSLQGQEQGQQQQKQAPKCVCGQRHWYAECAYLDASVAPSGWTENPAIRKRIDEQLAKPEKKARIDQAIKNSKERKAKQQKENIDKNEIPHQSFTSVFTTFRTNEEFPLRNSFILDSGADIHVCNNIDRAIGPIRPADTGERLAAGSGWIPILGYGEVEVKTRAPAPRDQQTMKLKNVAFIPSFFTSVVSLKKLIAGGIDWLVRENRLILKDQIFCFVEPKLGQWVLEFNEIQQSSTKSNSNQSSTFVVRSAQARVSQAPAAIWHERLAHCGPEVLEHLPTTVTGVRLANGPSTTECETCAVGKAHKIVSRRPSPEAEKPFDRIHWDMIHFHEGFNGDKYASHFLDDKTRMNWVFTHSEKTQKVLLNIFEEFAEYIKRQFERKIKIFRNDNESALGNDFKAWTRREGIDLETSVPYSPEQNGSAERSGGVIVAKARCIRIHANLPEEMWPETVKAAAYLVNRTPTKRLAWKSPAESLQNALGRTVVRPDISHLRVYGCKVYAYIPQEVREREAYHKLAPRARIGYLVGYDSTNIFRIWFPQLREVRPEKNVAFNELEFFDPKDLDEPLEDIIVTIEVPELPTIPPGGFILEDFEEEEIGDTIEVIPPSSQPSSENSKAISTPSTPPALPTPSPTASPEPAPMAGDAPAASTAPVAEPAPAPAEPAQSSEISTVSKPSREIFGNPEDPRNIIEGRRTRKPTSKPGETPAAAFLQAFSLGSLHQDPSLHRDRLPPPPRNWRELLNHLHRNGFAKAAQTEWAALEKKDTFEIIEKSRIDINGILPLMWVFDYKLDLNGYLARYKARICVRGDLQPISAHETYAATVKMKIFRFILALTAAFDLDTWHADITNAFLNSRLDEDVYCKLPDGFAQPGKCIKLLRALYGLRRAPRLWQQELSDFLETQGLRQVKEESCLFTNDDGIFLLFYVDDILMVSRKDCETQALRIRNALLARYELKDLGELKWYLGIRIIRDRARGKLWMCQDSYLEKIVHRYHLEFRKYPSTPMTIEPMPPNSQQATPQQILAYQGKTGSINYATVQTRPDAARAASHLAEFATNPSQQHQDAADQTILYLDGTRYLAIEYSASATGQEIAYTKPLEVASDASFGNCATTRRSSEGYLFKLFGGPIDWVSVKQKTVTTSTTEAELLALTHAATEALWWNRLFEDVGFRLDHDLVINCDNQQTIRLLTKDLPTLVTKLKHVDIRQHWLREQIADNRINIAWISTSHMPADGLTKSLPKQKHQNFVQQLGLVDISKLGLIAE